MRSRLRHACRRLLHDERGIALPVAMLITVIGLGLAAIPIMASVNTQSGDRRDQSSDAALTAADSGADLAIQRQTMMTAKVTTAKPCVKKSGTTLEAVATEASGWCPRVPTTGTETVGSASFSYRVKPTTGAMSVVSTGTSTAGGKSVNRRLMVNATSSGGTTPTVFGSEGVVGLEWIKMLGSASIYGNAGSNGYIDWTGGNPSMPGCTQMRGEFRKLDWQTTPCPAVKETRTYPDVVVPETNSNGRMFTAGGDTYTWSNGALGGCGASAASWCPTTKVLKLTNDATVTLGGEAPYVFCQLIIQDNTQLTMAAGKKIQIIFESPEKCGLASGTAQMRVENSGRIVSQSYSPSKGNYSAPGFYFVGSTESGSKFRQTKLIMNGAATGNNVIIYGPKTDIEITNGASFGGAVLGKTVYLDGGTRTKPEGTGSFDPDENLPVASSGGGTYAQSAFIECTSTANETTPSTGC
jgi:hypothetical protein